MIRLIILTYLILCASLSSFAQEVITFKIVEQSSFVRMRPHVDFLIPSINNYFKIEVDENVVILDTLFTGGEIISEKGNLGLTPFDARQECLLTLVVKDLDSDKTSFYEKEFELLESPRVEIKDTPNDFAINHFLLMAPGILTVVPKEYQIEVTEFQLEFFTEKNVPDSVLSASGDSFTRAMREILIDTKQGEAFVIKDIKAQCQDGKVIDLPDYYLNIIEVDRPIKFAK